MSLLTAIPKVDILLSRPDVQRLLDAYPRPVVVGTIRSILRQLRAAALEGKLVPSDLAPEQVCRRLDEELARSAAGSLRQVINGTGVVIHTNLGRSVLPDAVRESLDRVVSGYCNLEFDLATGERGRRHSHVEGVLCELTGAEAALVVNNNAAAVLLALSAMAAGREVLVSRGELVEIGGSFRIPDVMRQGGALLREVGTTNRTHLRDYREAVSSETGLLLKVHTSNFAIVGFTAQVEPRELASFGREVGVPTMVDMGSGMMVDLSRWIGGTEPTVRELIAAGADIVTFSGDKLLGGPQAGIIVGRSWWIDAMKSHPLLRAVRMDKLNLAVLEGTLRLYRDERVAMAQIPTLRMLCSQLPDLRRRGRSLIRSARRVSAPFTFSLVDGFSQVGGGTLPLLQLPTVLLSVEAAGVSPQALDAALRHADPPVIGRIQKGQFLLDLRTILDRDMPLLARVLQTLKV